MKLSLKEIETYKDKLNILLDDLCNLSWSGLESQIKLVTVKHLKSKVSNSFKDETEVRVFADQISEPISSIEKAIKDIIIEKYKIINAYKGYPDHSIEIEINNEKIKTNYEALKSLLGDLKKVQRDFYGNILNIKEETRYGVRDGIFINDLGEKVEYEYDVVTHIKPIYDKQQMKSNNNRLKTLIYEIEGKIDQFYINKEIEYEAKYLMVEKIEEIFQETTR